MPATSSVTTSITSSYKQPAGLQTFFNHFLRRRVPHILDFFLTNWKGSLTKGLSKMILRWNTFAGQYLFPGRRGQPRHEGRWRRWRRGRTPTTSWCSPPTGMEEAAGSRVQTNQVSRSQSRGCKWKSGKLQINIASHIPSIFEQLIECILLKRRTVMNWEAQGVYKRVVGEDQPPNGQLDPRLRISSKGNPSSGVLWKQKICICLDIGFLIRYRIHVRAA